MSGRVKAQKRSLSQPPAAEPAAKKEKAPKRISLLDIFLLKCLKCKLNFGLDSYFAFLRG